MRAVARDERTASPKPTQGFGWALLITFSVVVCAGCASSPDASPAVAQTATWSDQLTTPTPITELDALVVPPLKWRRDPLKTSERHNHQVWVSPDGGTAYGVIYFTLPLPVGEDLALHGFLAEMKRSEGEATLLSRNRDREVLRFIAEGGKYRVRGILRTRGFHGWAVYAGTLRAAPVSVDDLELAVQARENTALGLEDSSKLLRSETSKDP